MVRYPYCFPGVKVLALCYGEFFPRYMGNGKGESHELHFESLDQTLRETIVAKMQAYKVFTKFFTCPGYAQGFFLYLGVNDLDVYATGDQLVHLIHMKMR